MTRRYTDAWRAHLPLLRTSLIIVVLLAGISWMLASLQSRDGSVRTLEPSDWHWAPASSYDEPSAPSDGWLPLEPNEKLPAKIVWLRVPLPDDNAPDPHLRVRGVGSLRVFDGSDRIFSYLLDKQKWIVPIGQWKMVELPSTHPAYIDLLVRFGKPSRMTVDAAYGDKSGLFGQMLREDLDNLLIGVLLIFSGCISLGLYKSQRNRLYIYFSLLAVSGGYAALVQNDLQQAIIDVPVLSYIQNVCLPIATFAFVGAMEQVFEGINGRTIRFFRHAALALSAFAIIGAMTSLTLYMWSILLFTPIFIVTFIAVFWTIWVAYRRRRDLESIWIMAGFSSLAAITFIHIYRFIIYDRVPEQVQETTAWVLRLPKDLLFLGLFAFVICLIRVIMYRYMAMNRQLTEFNRSLEQIVQTRTYELQVRTEQFQRANERLAASMRENAEAMAEAMIMEERHRITGSIHDTVGHTLSDTVVHMEEAKRMISQDREQAEEKLAASQELLRRGLEDIRQSVRLLREDAGHYDLPGAIGALIRETEQATGCKFERQIGPLPSQLSTLQKRLLFQTLQEGIAIGLKRKEPARQFRLSVFFDQREETVRLKLSDHGRPLRADDWGIGLRALAEQADRLGGWLTAEATEEGNCLSLTIPAAPGGASSWII
ncbi:MAG: hypothetical protein J7559_05665 [Cohnella sp.]|nr:hypothetical protein [Cohnella sp.]